MFFEKNIKISGRVNASRRLIILVADPFIYSHPVNGSVFSPLLLLVLLGKCKYIINFR